MLRIAVFSVSFTIGAQFIKDMGWLALHEAILVAGVGAVLIVFAIPETNRKKSLRELIFCLLALLAVYGILLKFRAWLGQLTNVWLATLVSMALLLIAGVVLFLLLKPPGPQTGEPNLSQP